jgi:hypothetical protein
VRALVCWVAPEQPSIAPFGVPVDRHGWSVPGVEVDSRRLTAGAPRQGLRWRAPDRLAGRGPRAGLASPYKGGTAGIRPHRGRPYKVSPRTRSGEAIWLRILACGLPKMDTFDLSGGASFPQQVQRRSNKARTDITQMIRPINSASCGVSKRNNGVLGDSFNHQNVSSVPWLRRLKCCLMVQVRAKQTERTGQRI